MIQRIKQFLLHNTTEKQTIAKNTFWLFFGTSLSRVIKMAIVIYAARVLGTDEYGVFSYALSLAALLTIFLDFGINAILTRESARDTSVQKTYFSTALVIKLVMFVVVFALILIFAPFVIRQGEVIVLLPLVALMMGFDGLRDFGMSLARAWEKMEIESGVQIITNVLIVIAGFVALWISSTAVSLVWGYTAGIILGTVVAFYPFREYLKKPFASFDKTLVKKILVASWPFGMLGVMGAIMLNTDTIMVGWFWDIGDVGVYGATQRVIQVLYILPGFLAVASFPTMARFVTDIERMKRVLERGLSILTMVAVPLTVGGALLAYEIMFVLYGHQYIEGVSAFRWMCLTILPAFLSAMFGNALFALNKEKKLIRYVLLGVFGNFFFNLLLIPLWGIEGAAISTALNQTIITAYLVWLLKKEFHFRVFHQVGKIILATIAMGAGVVALRFFGMPVYVLVIAGMLLYFGMLAILKEESLREVWGKVNGK
jgi:O-antigen/teichoic acid export membrane protein